MNEVYKIEGSFTRGGANISITCPDGANISITCPAGEVIDGVGIHLFIVLDSFCEQFDDDGEIDMYELTGIPIVEIL